MWFQSTRPVRGATSRDGFGSWDTMRFNPRAPCGARRPYESAAVIVSSFQSTRPVRGATTLRECRRNRILVSIHAPRAGRDFRKADFAWGISVSIHAPRAGRDLDAPCHRHEHQRFQSTRPVRGATRRTCIVGNSARGFNPRAPCGARPIWVQVLLSCCVFQSTRPVRGATFLAFSSRPICSRFQSTRPVRGATVHLHRVRQLGQVSIHAPRAGRDVGEAQRLCGVPVSIHAPRAGRDMDGLHRRVGQGVSIHAPRAGRDHRHGLRRRQDRVSIHAPRAGRDGGSGANAAHMSKFQSTRPVRGATPEPSLPRTRLSFQSTRPVRGATCSIPSRIFWLEFQSTRPVRGATWT